MLTYLQKFMILYQFLISNFLVSAVCNSIAFMVYIVAGIQNMRLLCIDCIKVINLPKERSRIKRSFLPTLNFPLKNLF